MSPINGSPIDSAAIRALRQSTDPWQMSVRDTPERCDPARLYRVLLIVSPGANKIRLMTPLYEPDDAGELIRALEAAMLQTSESSLPAARPPALWVDCPKVAEHIGPAMAACGVPVEVKEALDAIDPVIEALSQRADLFSRGTLFGTRVRLAELASAAAEVAGCEPWRLLSDTFILRLTYDDSEVRFLFLTPAAGDDRVITGCRDETMLEGMEPDTTPVDGWLVRFFAAAETERPRRLAFSRHGLAVDHHLYPRLCMLDPIRGARDLTTEAEADEVERDLRALAACCRSHAEMLTNGTFDRAELALAGGCRVLVEAQPQAATGLEAVQTMPSEVTHEDGIGPLIATEHAVSITQLKPEMLQRIAPELVRDSPRPGLIIRCRRRDTSLVAAKVATVDVVTFAILDDTEWPVELIVAMNEDEILGALASRTFTDDGITFQEQLHDAPADELVIVLAAGLDQRVLSDNVFRVLTVPIVPPATTH